jgi:hypothetical protein
MAFSESTKDEIFKNSGGRCQCNRQHSGQTDAPHHGGRCPRTFTRYGAWEAHHKVAVSSGGKDIASNGEALCSKCHQLTQTYGAS